MKTPSNTRKILLCLIGMLIAAYGIFVFISRDFHNLFALAVRVCLLDYEEPIWSFYLDYICLMGLWVFAAHYLSKGLRKLGGAKKSSRRKGKMYEKLLSLMAAMLLVVSLAACQSES